jgi:hypothetical protein
MDNTPPRPQPNLPITCQSRGSGRVGSQLAGLKRPFSGQILIGTARFELAASCSQSAKPAKGRRSRRMRAESLSTSAQRSTSLLPSADHTVTGAVPRIRPGTPFLWIAILREGSVVREQRRSATCSPASRLPCCCLGLVPAGIESGARCRFASRRRRSPAPGFGFSLRHTSLVAGSLSPAKGVPLARGSLWS